MATLAERQAFLEKVQPYANAIEQKYGIPESVVIAQAALESAWGTSTLAKDFNNFFGIKGTGAALPTWEVIGGERVEVTAEFQSYTDPAGSFEGYAQLLQGDRYAGLKGVTDPEAFAAGLQAAGYATDPEYADKLTGLIEGYRLTAFDNVDFSGSYRPPLFGDPLNPVYLGGGGAAGDAPQLGIVGTMVRFILLGGVAAIVIIGLFRALPVAEQAAEPAKKAAGMALNLIPAGRIAKAAGAAGKASKAATAAKTAMKGGG